MPVIDLRSPFPRHRLFSTFCLSLWQSSELETKVTSNAPKMSGITIKTAPHGPNTLGAGYTQTPTKPMTNAEDLLKASCQRGKSLNCKSVLESSFQPHLNQPQAAPLYASSNGFVKGAIDAYNQHHHFVIRPEDGESCSRSDHCLIRHDE